MTRHKATHVIWRAIAALAAISRLALGQASRDELTLVVRPAELRDSTLARVIQEILAITADSAWSPYLVRPGESLSSILYSTYRIGDTYRGVSGRLLQNEVARRNALDSARSLSAGQRLLLPPLPQFPERPAPSNRIRAQQTWQDGMMGMATARGEIFGARAPASSTREHDAPEWRIALPYARSSAQYARFQSDLLSTASSTFVDIREVSDYVVPAVVEQAELIDEESAFPDPLAQADDPNALAAVQADPRVTLFILDFFAERFGHGAQVREIASLMLGEMGLSSLSNSPRIIPVDFDLKHDTANKIALVERWLAEAGRNGRPGWSTITKDYWRREFQRSIQTAQNAPGLQVSMLYYQAVMDSIRRTPGTKVITSSFYVRAESVAPFRVLDFPSSAMEFYFSASGNENEALETIGDWSLRQPQSTYYAVSQRHPLFLVAGELPSGKRRGVWSRVTPWAVPFVGRAGKWGGGRNSCVNPRTYSTSYAAPAVATALFGALNFWRSRGVPVSNRDLAIHRLVSASTVNSRLVGTHLAPGRLDSERLLLGKGTLARTLKGETVTTSGTPTGVVAISTDNTQVLFRLDATSGDRLLGLHVSGGDVYFVSTSSPYWRRGALERVDITLGTAVPGCPNEQGGGCVLKSAEALQSLLSYLTVSP